MSVADTPSAFVSAASQPSSTSAWEGRTSHGEHCPGDILLRSTMAPRGFDGDARGFARCPNRCSYPYADTSFAWMAKVPHSWPLTVSTADQGMLIGYDEDSSLGSTEPESSRSLHRDRSSPFRRTVSTGVRMDFHDDRGCRRSRSERASTIVVTILPPSPGTLKASIPRLLVRMLHGVASSEAWDTRDGSITARRETSR